MRAARGFRPRAELPGAAAKGTRAILPTPRLHALATAVPPYALDQEQVRERARLQFAGRARDIERLLPVYDHAGIATRYSCMPIEWYTEPHGWAEKNALFLQHAVTLLERSARQCLANAGLQPEDIDGIVAASTTGIATPSLDALLIERLGLRRDVLRVPLFGLGCAGGVLGLARAAEFARAAPQRTMLFCVVELCGLTFRANDLSKSNLIATALFGDGAAAALLSCQAAGPRLTAWGEHTWRDSLDVMGWRVEDDGLGVLFSRDIPSLVRAEFGRVAADFLARHELQFSDIDTFVCHPGGTKVLDALEDAFGLTRGALADSRAVLRDYGNMSAATVLFVLERVLRGGARGRHLMSAMGPGFSAGFLTLEDA